MRVSMLAMVLLAVTMAGAAEGDRVMLDGREAVLQVGPDGGLVAVPRAWGVAPDTPPNGGWPSLPAVIPMVGLPSGVSWKASAAAEPAKLVKAMAYRAMEAGAATPAVMDPAAEKLFLDGRLIVGVREPSGIRVVVDLRGSAEEKMLLESRAYYGHGTQATTCVGFS